MRKLAFLCLILLIAGCKKGETPGAEGEKKEEHTAVVETAIATVHPMETVVVAQGTLVPGQGAVVRVMPVVAGRLLEVNVREGEHVKAGQLVAVLDNRPQQMQAKSAEAALAVSQTQAEQSVLAARAQETDQKSGVRVAKLALSAALQDKETSVKLAETALQSAQTDYERTKAGSRPQEIAQAVQAVAVANSTRNRAKTELDRVKFLYEKGVVAKRQWDDAKTALEVANATLVSAQQQESLLRAGARVEEIRAAELRVKQAQQTLNQTLLSTESKVAQAQAALLQAEQSHLQVEAKQREARAAQQTILQKRADWEATQEMAQTAFLRATLEGVVTKRNLNKGDFADTTTPILEITNGQSLNLIANISADWGQRVRVGQKVRISLPDMAESEFSGSVLSTGQVDPQTNLLSVRIGIENRGGRLKVGQFASASIVLEVHPQAVTIPTQALVTREGKSVVFLFGADGKAHQQVVQVGTEQETLVEITEGLKAGAKIIRLGQYELRDGATVEEKKAEPEKEKGGSKE